ncbi:MAG: tRNA pseudouridine(13) synthase TruD [Candidatus Woesearchaeota archaeon]
MKIKQVPEDFIVKEISTINPEKEGEYTYFLLKKRNYTTLRALQKISEALKAPAKAFGCAGNKDKTAITEQVCSLKNASQADIEKVSLKDIEVKYLGKGSKPVSLGDLKGNHFEISVRDIETIPTPKTRFINYFGSQRFGINNAEIGKAIIKKDFKKAVALILLTKSIAAQAVHKSLAIQPKNYIGALKVLPIKLLRLYVHAYQSLLWNELAKKHAETSQENVKLPVIGFGTTPNKMLEETLKRENITPRDFVIKEFPELSSEGTERDVFVEATELKISPLEDDELKKGKKKAKFCFSLQKGAYATEFIKQLFS